MSKQKVCKSCGSVYSGSPYSYYCPDCAARARRDNAYRTRVCIDCGANFMGYPKSKRCPRCSGITKAARDAEYKKLGPARRLGGIDQCVICGNDYVIESGLQRYCKQCAPAAYKAKDNASSSAWNQSHKETLYPVKNDRRRAIRYCVICGASVDSGSNSVTCINPACKRKRLSQQRALADFKRGKRKTPPDGYTPTK